MRFLASPDFPWFLSGLALEATVALIPHLRREHLWKWAGAAAFGAGYAIFSFAGMAQDGQTLGGAIGSGLLVYAAVMAAFFFGTYLPTIDERAIHVWSVVLACVFLFGPQPFTPWHLVPAGLGLLSLLPALSPKPLSGTAKAWLYVWYLVLSGFFIVVQLLPGLKDLDAWNGPERLMAGMMSFQLLIGLTVLATANRVPGKKHPSFEEQLEQLAKVGRVLADRFDDDQHDPRIALVLTAAIAGAYALNHAIGLLPFWSLTYAILLGALFLADRLPSYAPRPRTL